MDRREILRSGVAAALASCLPTLDLPRLWAASEPPLPEFPDAVRQLITAVADALIPRTDTPGALDVGTPAFTERLLRHAGTASFDAFVTGAGAFAAAAAEVLNAPFGTAPPDARHRCLQQLDQSAFSGAPASPGSAMAFLQTLKRLTVIGHYTSDAGAHAELDVQLYPGPFQGSLPLAVQPKTYYEDAFGTPNERPPGYLRA